MPEIPLALVFTICQNDPPILWPAGGTAQNNAESVDAREIFTVFFRYFALVERLR
jgi:hypothetical protein